MYPESANENLRERYHAYGLMPRAFHSLRIALYRNQNSQERTVITGMWRKCTALPTEVKFQPFGTNFMLQFEKIDLAVEGRNLGSLINSFKTHDAAFLRCFSERLHITPLPGAPIIERIGWRYNCEDAATNYIQYVEFARSTKQPSVMDVHSFF